MTFGEEAVSLTVSKLLSDHDYRDEVINAVNVLFFDFSIKFFRQILNAKITGQNINMNWYKNYFLNSEEVIPEEAAIYAGLNKKTITNTYGSATKAIILTAAKNNLDYLLSLLTELDNDLAVSINICCNDITVKLSLIESLLVINALATKKIQIRGSAWSSIGKSVEKPLVDELCRLAGVPTENIDSKNLDYDREVDYKLISRTGKIYKIEVKPMGKGNPESADAAIARDSDIFIADTLSEQNRHQLTARGIEHLMLRDNPNSLNNFIEILDRLNIPHNKNRTVK